MIITFNYKDIQTHLNMKASFAATLAMSASAMPQADMVMDAPTTSYNSTSDFNSTMVYNSTYAA